MLTLNTFVNSFYPILKPKIIIPGGVFIKKNLNFLRTGCPKNAVRGCTLNFWRIQRIPKPKVGKSEKSMGRMKIFGVKGKKLHASL